VSLSKKRRFEVFKRDLFTCQYCGRRPPDVVLECDHVTPRCEGGSDDMDNLATSCWECNRGKAGNGLEATLPAVDELARLAAIQEMSERSRVLLQQQESARANEELTASTVETIYQWWDQIVGWCGYFQEASVRHFLRRNLSLPDIREAIETTAFMYEAGKFRGGDASWRYFCGICWSKIRQQEGAA